MATIILKGTDKKIETTISKCEKINELKRQKADPKTPIELEGLLVELGDIRYAIPDNEKDKELIKEEKERKWDAEQRSSLKNHRDEIINLANGSLKDKIEYNLKIASFYCYSFTGKWLKEWAVTNDISELNKILVDELKKVKLVVDPRKYKNVFSVDFENDSSRDKMASSNYMSRSFPLNFMLRQIDSVYQVIGYPK
jgi:hypothetical protein